jgi:hypothetical protein
MNIIELKQWLINNLRYSRGLICKKCKGEWFIKYNHNIQWDYIHSHTSYLNNFNPSIPQRVWHILNDKNFVKCANPKCNNPPTFFSFNRGYLRACSPSCAQLDPKTLNKIKQTNIKKYGVEYGLSNKNVIKKRNETVQKRYSVKNISQLSNISDKKKETCLKNYGTEWFLERQDLKEQVINDKYGVNNVQQVSEVAFRRIETRRGDFYDTLIFSNRLKNKCIPLFTRDEYIKTGIEYKYLFECTRCKYEFNGWLHDGDVPRCTNCYPLVGSSLFEKEIAEYVKSLLPIDNVEENNRNILVNNRELDIYIPSKKLAIECNGLFWHGEDNGNKDRIYHISKTVECESKNIRLVHIFEDEWISSKDIVKSKLKHLLKLNENKIFARNCDVVELLVEPKREFLNENHIQGDSNSKVDLGIKIDNKLISVMTFCPHRIFMGGVRKDGEFELLRYATGEFNVIGGASKLLSYFIRKYAPKRITSYADRRWTYSKGNLYEKIGFKKISDGTPNYWYFGRGKDYKRHHRFGFAKHTLSKRLPVFDPSLSEWENMKNNGWDRIWDCGNLKYEMIIN